MFVVRKPPLILLALLSVAGCARAPALSTSMWVTLPPYNQNDEQVILHAFVAAHIETKGEECDLDLCELEVRRDQLSEALVVLADLRADHPEYFPTVSPHERPKPTLWNGNRKDWILTAVCKSAYDQQVERVLTTGQYFCNSTQHSDRFTIFVYKSSEATALHSLRLLRKKHPGYFIRIYSR